ncbi:unnamed protein product [Bursaphelenchus xylophilus]|uniref:(pine wood nematode) hypothetical protein n=1 Tax=Bursaphelenchus xylophilus TaxID=6326 RepID=A0A1I7SRE8_BURXY|nr:unnamed protein product [Bursaphelenchus xylophilus]CAG9102525.1 unnamed protein product [Bursaphelenchus xylophilus]
MNSNVKYQNPWDRLVKIGEGKFRTNEGHNDPNVGHNMIFGGSLVSNAVHCCYEGVPKGWHLSNLHSYFLRAGNGDLPTEYEVQTLRDGRNFVFRQVNVKQDGKLIYSAQLTFRNFPNKLLLPQISMPEVPKPEEVKTSIELLNEYKKTKPDERLFANATMRISVPFIELRPVCGMDYLIGPPKPTRKQLLWTKWKGTPASSTEQFAVTALSAISDFGLSIAGSQFFYNVPMKVQTSLDQNVWIHRTDFDLNEYILLEQNADWHSDGNTFIQGRIWTQNGTLLASLAQNVVVEPVVNNKL